MAESATASCGPLFLCVTLYLAIVVAVQGQDVIYPNNSNGINDSCVLTSGAKGICKLIQGCPVVEKTFKVKRPKICSFQGRIPIVCCPQGLRDSVIDISPPTTDFECGLPQPGPIQPVPLQPEPTRSVHLLPERRTRAIPPPTASLSVIPFPEVLIHHAMLGVPSAQNAWPWMVQ
ncbi:unnamed protein product [Meganyctiphanes norvegica]|uniref:Clip domain-containing protein n=1 Tax=Meganyctiphanes norvegica TaxID=48144 RepID=A0AAV2QFC6_MEGNR